MNKIVFVLEFPNGGRGSMLLNFGDRTRTGVFSMIWPLTRGSGELSVYKDIFRYYCTMLMYMYKVVDIFKNTVCYL